MSDLTFVPDERPQEIVFETATVHNLLVDLCMLNQDHLDHISPWVDQTVSRISPEEKKMAELGCGAVIQLRWSRAKSMAEFIEALSAADPQYLIDNELDQLVRKAEHYLAGEDLPSREELRDDRESYVGLVRRLMERNEKGGFDEDESTAEWRRFQDPKAYQEKLVAALEHFWNSYLRDEWNRIENSIGDSVAAFRSVRVRGSSLEDRLKFITGRDFIPTEWLETLAAAQTIVYVPSVHIGPYMILFDFDGTTAYVVGRARIPEGATVHSPTLDLSDLLTRLDALSDSSRMRILALSAERGVITTQDVIDSLELSQSSASRHLNQLAATGLLKLDGSERTKKYRVNPARIDDVCAGLKSLVAARTDARPPADAQSPANAQSPADARSARSTR